METGTVKFLMNPKVLGSLCRMNRRRMSSFITADLIDKVRENDRVNSKLPKDVKVSMPSTSNEFSNSRNYTERAGVLRDSRSFLYRLIAFSQLVAIFRMFGKVTSPGSYGRIRIP